MPPKKARPRPIVWKVTGGAQSGGLIVRGGSETTSPELPERLATKSVIQELEVQGERMRYKLVTGSGPPTGWIGTKFKGKDLLKKRPLKAWILATGTRGDIQPYLALAVGMQNSGYEMDIWTCEDYRSFVEDYGIRMHSIAASVEEMLRETQNLSNNKGAKDKAKDGKKKRESEKDEKEKQKEKEMSALSMMIHARWLLSLNSECTTVAGIHALKMLPKEVEERLSLWWRWYFYTTNAGTLAAVGYVNEAETYAKEAERLDKQIKEEEEEQKKKEGGEADVAVPSAAVPSSGSAGAEADGKDPDEPDWDAIEEETKAKPEAGLAKIMGVANFVENPDASYQMVKTYVALRNYWKKGWEGIPDLGIMGIECLFLNDIIQDESYLNALMEEIKKNPPDIVLYNMFWSQLASAVEAKCGIPSVLLNLQPHGLFFGDPTAAQWVSEEQWPLLQQINPALYQFSSLAEARERYTIEDTPDLGYWAKAVLLEEEVLTPSTGVHPIRDMGPVEWHRRQREKVLCGFLSSIASDRFLQYMGDFSKASVAKSTYTGFWIMSEKHQIGDNASSMFGGPELMQRIEDFIAAGDKPAYIGWGSCICNRGRSWMIALAVASLKEAKLRGIILGGWAELNMELLQELVGEEDSLGLVEYAKKNILFIKKAPQVWLFPRCSVVVIHGGVGTLAAAWTSGTPLIICPVWLDQFGNQWLNTLMGAGVAVPRVDDCSVKELAGAMHIAVTDKAIIRGAQAVQFSMMMDNGVQKAMECIDDILLEDVPSGKWKEWFTSP